MERRCDSCGYRTSNLSVLGFRALRLESWSSCFWIKSQVRRHFESRGDFALLFGVVATLLAECLFSSALYS